jgi:hypothetical protein
MKFFSSLWLTIVGFVAWVFTGKRRLPSPATNYAPLEIKQWFGPAEKYLEMLNNGKLDDNTDYTIYGKPWEPTRRTLGGYVSLPLGAVLVVRDDKIVIENVVYDEATGQLRDVTDEDRANAENLLTALTGPTDPIEVVDEGTPVMFTEPPQATKKPRPKLKASAKKIAKKATKQSVKKKGR